MNAFGQTTGFGVDSTEEEVRFAERGIATNSFVRCRRGGEGVSLHREEDREGEMGLAARGVVGEHALGEASDLAADRAVLTHAWLELPELQLREREPAEKKRIFRRAREPFFEQARRLLRAGMRADGVCATRSQERIDRGLCRRRRAVGARFYGERFGDL
ncbi:MAG: hypothetical protein ABI551_08415, partial [Polyangiaceae bacterium]